MSGRARQVAQTLSADPDGDDRAAAGVGDLIFAFHRLTWNASVPAGAIYAQAHLARALVADPRPRRLLVADHATSAPVVLGRRLTGRLRPFPASDRVRHTTPLRLRRRDPVGLPALERSYRRSAATLRRAARREGLSSPALLTTNALLAAYADVGGWTSGVTYYATDDFAVPGFRLSHAYAAAYERLRERRVDVAAVTGEILERIAPTGRTLVVPNGIEPQEWRAPPPPPAWFSELPRPRLLYTGGLMSRVDREIVASLSTAFPQGSVVFVGVLIDPEHFAFTAELANVHVRPPVGRHELTGLVAAADVGLVPHVRNAMTQTMSPLKAYEYLAAGLPVVSTPLPELGRLGDRVLLREPAAFSDGVRAALALGRESEQARIAFVEANSWSSRYDALLEFVAGGG